MKSYLTNKNGLALIGILVASVIAVFLFYGGFSFFKKRNQNYNASPKDTIDIYKKAAKDLNEINNTIKTNNKQLDNLLKQATSSIN